MQDKLKLSMLMWRYKEKSILYKKRGEFSLSTTYWRLASNIHKKLGGNGVV